MQRFLPKQLHLWLPSWTLTLLLTELRCPKVVCVSDPASYTSMRWSKTRIWVYTQLVQTFLHMLEP